MTKLMIMTKMITPILFAFCQTSHAAGGTTGEGPGNGGGGDGRVMQAPVSAPPAFVKDLKGHLITFIKTLRQNSRNYAPQNGQPPLLADELLADIENTPPYNFGKCGNAADGFPLSGAALNGVAHAAVCFDPDVIRNLYLTKAQIIGLAVHEHCRHIKCTPGAFNENYRYANEVSLLYEAVMMKPVKGECSVRKISLLGNLEFKQFLFVTQDLENGIRQNILGKNIYLHLDPVDTNVPNLKEVTMEVDGTDIKTFVNVHGQPEGWTRNDFVFSLSIDRPLNPNTNWRDGNEPGTYITCRSLKNYIESVEN